MRKVKNVGKPDEGKLHVRFDEEGQVGPCPLLYRGNPGPWDFKGYAAIPFGLRGAGERVASPVGNRD
ncbi:MAG TPA: hypothetical protein DDW65_07770 [Firmicutes bacterium]|jgi:hypothetical protein|nr:hypothetical protein [Bacillota bacterium]